MGSGLKGRRRLFTDWRFRHHHRYARLHPLRRCSLRFLHRRNQQNRRKDDDLQKWASQSFHLCVSVCLIGTVAGRFWSVNPIGIVEGLNRRHRRKEGDQLRFIEGLMGSDSRTQV
jgi:hypothetical protein